MKRKLKIAILIDQLVPGGVQKSAINEAIEIKKLGHEVTIFVLVKLDYQYQFEDLAQGLEITYLSDFNPIFFKKPIRIPYFSFLTHLHLINPWFVNRYKKLKKYDFLISHGTTTCITAAAITKKLKIPYLAFVYDPMLYILEKVYSKTPVRYFFSIVKPLTYRYERSYLTSAALVITQSKVHQEFMKSIYHVNPIVITLGCKVFPKLPQKKISTNQFLAYSRWQMAKKPHLFIWLAKRLPKTTFLIAGTWTNQAEETQFKKLIRNSNLQSRIHLKSQLSEQEITQIASQSIAWVHPHFEAFGMGGLEMAAHGLPIIIPQNSGVTELFKENIHGFFPAEKDKQVYLKYLKLFLRNPQRAKKMGQMAAKVAQRYTWELHAKSVVGQIQTYLSQNKIVFIANAFVTDKSTGGGDLFFFEMVRRVPNRVFLTIILPFPGLNHWIKAKIYSKNIRLIVLPKSPFDNIDLPIRLFLAYLIRSVQTLFLLNRLPSYSTICTATDMLPDVIPAFVTSQIQPKTPWASRFFHFIEPPHKRKGRFWVNIGSYLLQQLSLKLIKSANIVLIDNPNLISSLIKKDVKPDNIELHPGGVDLELISQARIKSAYQSDALFVGRLQPHKGIFDAIQTWQKVVEQIPTAKLTLIGHGPYNIMSKIRKQIRSTGLEQNIISTGFIHDRKTIAQYLCSSKLLLFLDHEAGFGLVIAEAMATGLPVISYKLPIFGSTYKRGFIAAPLGDINAVSKNVIELLTNNRKYSKISSMAIKEGKKFNWDQAAINFYQSLQQISQINQHSNKDKH